ncbi:MAG TPA: hypothetical protein VK783_03300 [Bacteroidia bacterium]|jgi:hypothetical protein|nr:hypothetical protein [Bacteroidia bacterium]
MNYISEYNYEAFFLDYHEGRMDETGTKELMDFLARHPELKHEFENFESVSLNDLEEIKFENKESLKKNVAPVNAASFDDMAIEYVEGNLNPVLTEELLKFAKQNPKYGRELATYLKTKLVPEVIAFEDKESLKRNSRQHPVAWYYWSAAASVALLIGAYFLINKSNDQPAVNIVSLIHKTDTVHHATQPVLPVTNNSNTNTVAQNNASAVSSEKNAVLHSAHHVIRHSYNYNTVVNISKHDSNVAIAVQHNTVIIKNDSIIQSTPNDLASVQHPDTSAHKIVQQVVQNVPNYINPDAKNRSVFTFASNTVKGIRNFFKYSFGVNRYYDKETDKVIAYQIVLGDNRFNVPLRNNSY